MNSRHHFRACLLFAATALLAPVDAQVGLWAELPASNAPAPAVSCASAFDASRGRLVVLAGSLNQTWEFDGHAWLDTGLTGPQSGGQITVAAVYDAARQVVVAVRGNGPNQATETWEWDGVAWTAITTATSPVGRFHFALAYDSQRAVTVLNGGVNGTGALSDTWEYDGSNWVLRTTGGPQARALHAMAFDSARGEVVLFGGHSMNINQNFSDTWRWNGIYWIQDLVSGPGARSYHTMAYDSTRQRTVLQGGRPHYGGGSHYNDAWEWDGSQWTPTTPATPTVDATSAYDPNRRRILLFGGLSSLSGQTFNQVWAYTKSSQLATIQSYGSGCPGPNGTPSLTANSIPQLGATLASTLANLPTGALNLPFGFLGFDNTQWNGVPLPASLSALGFPGCVALLAPAQVLLLSATPGTVNWDIEIPFYPGLIGSHFYLQGGVLVLGFNPGGIVFSAGLDATLGV